MIRQQANIKSNTAVISRKAAGVLGLGSGGSLQVQLGGSSSTVRLRVSDKLKGLRFAPGVARRLGLPNARGIRLYAWLSGNQLRLGPVIGIFTHRVRPDSTPTGGAIPLVYELCRLGRRRGYLVFAFTPGDVNWATRRVLGYYPANGVWVRRSLPFPDVVYDRVSSRSAARRPALRLTQKRLIATVGARYFNRRFFDKLEIHTALQQDETVRPYLPETEPYTGAQALAAKAGEWGAVWLKPSNGSLGRGIIVVRRTPGGNFRVFHRRRHRWRRQVVTTIGGLRRLLERRLLPGRYLMQRDLHLSRYRGRPFDVRVLLQRGHDGQWERTKLYARVAPRGSFTSNIAQGGEGLPFRDVAARATGVLPKKVDAVLDTMRWLSDALVKALEEQTGEQLGEVALDLGIDRKGRVWFIEANSKPFRSVQTTTGSMKVVRRALVRPLQYAAYLTGFGRSAQKGVVS